MTSLFSLWREKVPSYGVNFKPLFELIAKNGALGGNRIGLGRHFDTQYELYIYAFFLGLYKGQKNPIPSEISKTNFSHHIKGWGEKSSAIRENFADLQKYMFTAIIAKTDIDLIELEKGNIEAQDVVKDLMFTFESYTNGGLTLIHEKMEENPNYFIHSTAFMEFILN